MRAYSRYIFVTMLVAVILYSCKKAYTPDAVAENVNLLVVEGVINAGTDSTIIKLSRTVQLVKGRGINPETGAQVKVEDENGGSYDLQEKPDGLYVAPVLNLDKTKKYRLRIKSGSKEYLSDFVEVKTTPAIDDVKFNIKSNELDINIDTHDDSGNSRYYRWEFEQTWEFNANFFSTHKSNGDTVLARDLANDNIYHCWTGEISKTIVLGSSAKLSADIIKNNTILTIPGSSEKISLKYSILVKQYALTKTEFEFWQTLKKNTEQLGTIFDPQPSQIQGNIHCVSDPAEIVIGYVGACTVTQQRRFIDKNQLLNFRTIPFYTDCKADSILLKRPIPGGGVVNEENIYFNRNKGATVLLVPLDAISERNVLLGHMGTIQKCADCTLRGTKRKPDFWE